MIYNYVLRRIQKNRGDFSSGGAMKKTSFFLLLFVGAAILVWLGMSPDGSRAADDSKVTIVYSSNLLGYTEPCG